MRNLIIVEEAKAIRMGIERDVMYVILVSILYPIFVLYILKTKI
jgi:hypothetical protein